MDAITLDYVNAITLDYVVAPADIADYVGLFYNFRADVPVLDDTERAGTAQLRFRLTPGVATYSFVDGTYQRAADYHLLGPTSGARHIHTDGPVHVFGMGITPAGWAAMIGIDASEMLNRVMDASELFGDRMGQIADALRAAGDTAAMIEIGRALVYELLTNAATDAVDFMHQVDAWLADSPSPDLATLIDATGLSRRQVERRCNAMYGAPPKLLARKYRALRAAVALMTEGEPMDDLIDRGFYDQSHLIREIKQFTGLTPGQMRERPNVLARMTVGRRHAMNGRVNPLISQT